MNGEQSIAIRAKITALISAYIQMASRHVCAKNEVDLEQFSRILFSFQGSFENNMMLVGADRATIYDEEIETFEFYRRCFTLNDTSDIGQTAFSPDHF